MPGSILPLRSLSGSAMPIWNARHAGERRAASAQCAVLRLHETVLSFSGAVGRAMRNGSVITQIVTRNARMKPSRFVGAALLL